jgi:hypothetical protein
MLTKYDRRQATMGGPSLPNFGPRWCAAHDADELHEAESIPVGTRVLLCNDTEWIVTGSNDVLVKLRNLSGEATTRLRCSGMLMLRP